MQTKLSQTYILETTDWSLLDTRVSKGVIEIL